MSAFVGNLLDPADPSPTGFEGKDFNGFDLAIVGLGFHQFNDSALCCSQAYRALEDRGCVMVIDFLVQEISGGDGDVHSHGHRFGKCMDMAVTVALLQRGESREGLEKRK